jgi:hypothetical protein
MTNRKFTEDELVELVKAYAERMCGKCNVKDLGVCCNSCFLLPISLSADLINRQKAEIEKLRKCRKEEIEKLVRAIDKVITEAKAEAIKEFAERLKEKGIPVTGGRGFEGVNVFASNLLIDDLVKEMTEETK